MSGQIDKMSDKNEDLICPVNSEKLFPALFVVMFLLFSFPKAERFFNIVRYLSEIWMFV